MQPKTLDEAISIVKPFVQVKKLLFETTVKNDEEFMWQPIILTKIGFLELNLTKFFRDLNSLDFDLSSFEFKEVTANLIRSKIDEINKEEENQVWGVFLIANCTVNLLPTNQEKLEDNENIDKIFNNNKEEIISFDALHFFLETYLGDWNSLHPYEIVNSSVIWDKEKSSSHCMSRGRFTNLLPKLSPSNGIIN